jgi:hypothetical protein
LSTSARGLDLRAVPTWEKGAIVHNAFLTVGDRPWTDLADLRKDPPNIDRWTGVVYCERLLREDAVEARERLWPDACLYADPFLFFGDPELLKQIRAALAADD